MNYMILYDIIWYYMVLYGIYVVYISNWWPRYLTCFRKSRRASQWNMKGKNVRILTRVALNRGGLAICKKLSPVVRKSKWRNKDVLRQLSINKTRAQHCAGTQGCFTCNKASWNRLITSKSVFCNKIEHRSRHVHHCSVWVQMSTFIYHNRRCRMCGTTHFWISFHGYREKRWEKASTAHASSVDFQQAGLHTSRFKVNNVKWFKNHLWYPARPKTKTTLLDTSAYWTKCRTINLLSSISRQLIESKMYPAYPPCSTSCSLWHHRRPGNVLEIGSVVFLGGTVGNPEDHYSLSRTKPYSPCRHLSPCSTLP